MLGSASFGRCEFQTRKLARLQTDTMQLDLNDLTQQKATEVRANDYCRWLQCLYQSNDSPGAAAELYALRYPGGIHRELIKSAAPILLRKTAVNWGTTVDPAFAAPISPLLPLESA